MITIENLKKQFIVPHQRRDTLKESFLDVFKKKTYEKFEALSDINLKIEQGDFIGIVGRNGSGKSTLLKIMAGIYQPSGGSVVVEGRVAPFLELGVGFEPELTARENIFVNATLLGMSRKRILEKFREMVSFAEIEKFLDLKVKNYSSGMKARLAFAIAKEADADIYLCDEILAVGDEQFQRKCLEVFHTWKKQGKTIVFVSHNPAQVEDFCNRAVLIEDGKIINHGSPGEVLAEYHRRALTGQEPGKIMYR